MSRLVESLAQRAALDPQAVLLSGAGAQWSAARLVSDVHGLAERLIACGVRRVGLVADNGPRWIIADLALRAAGCICVPLPMFFSAAQRTHAQADAGLDAVLVEPGAAPPHNAAQGCTLVVADARWTLWQVKPRLQPNLPAGTTRITYTSGTTGAPRGVCLSEDHQWAVAQALAMALAAGPGDRCLNLLPLSTLLENLGGVDAALLSGAQVVSEPSADVGLTGSSGFEPMRALAALHHHGISVFIAVPQMLLALTLACEAGAPVPPRLRFVAVGGAALSPGLIARARAAGLPAYEGYGLSECASVVALNLPGADRPGSVGRPLPGLDVQVAADGEIQVAGRGFLGYVGQPPRDPASPVATGDLGYLDADGFLHVNGRARNLIITSYGRNLSPEWVERELLAQPAIAQAVVFGEARPYLTAVLVPRSGCGSQQLEAAVVAANAGLPDYAQLRHTITAEGWLPGGELLTANGRPRRAAIQTRYAAGIEALYALPNAPQPLKEFSDVVL